VPVRRPYHRRKPVNRLPLILFLVLVGVTILLFSDLGLIRWYQLHRQHQQLQAEIARMRAQRSELFREKDRLENDMDYIVRLAREKFRMVKPGEKVFRVIDRRRVEE